MKRYYHHRIISSEGIYSYNGNSAYASISQISLAERDNKISKGCDLRQIEAFLTLVDCNLMNSDNHPLFKFKIDAAGDSVLDMSEAEFGSVWATLHPAVASEIHDKILDVNIAWIKDRQKLLERTTQEKYGTPSEQSKQNKSVWKRIKWLFEESNPIIVNGYRIRSFSKLDGADLCDEQLEGVILYKAKITYANLRNVNLRFANLQWANLERSNLQNASLQRANLDGANLKNANLSGAILFGANLHMANMNGAILRNANLRGANLYGAQITNADLAGADLEWAIINNTNFSGSHVFVPKRKPLSSPNLPVNIPEESVVFYSVPIQKPSSSITLPSPLLGDTLTENREVVMDGKSLAKQNAQGATINTSSIPPSSLESELMVKCPRCGHKNPLEAKICEKCMRLLENTWSSS